jgi:hypothetical protein
MLIPGAIRIVMKYGGVGDGVFHFTEKFHPPAVASPNRLN